jgi:Pentapeptide repeats (9 copies)
MANEPTTRPEDSSKVSIEKADFASTTFAEEASFAGATFTAGADFAGATFTKKADFAGATFTERASFAGATFTERAIFAGATFTQWVIFAGATFAERASFEGAIFETGANFVNSKMKSETKFDGASFRRIPPLFDGTKLHEGTTWFGVTWPRSPRTVNAAILTVRAYERLKLEMDKLKKHEDELNFFALELKARHVLAGKWSTSHGMAIGLYGCLCDYGRSYSRPL